ncbi:hypothetical protein AGMMS50243_24270 [Betaproteobacteria bacterium]|nr:hypothetical protein AGMMS50243_24270 [Betaproteobacteria bacterium]
MKIDPAWVRFIECWQLPQGNRTNKDTYAKITADFDRMTIDESLSAESAISHICNLYNGRTP